MKQKQLQIQVSSEQKKEISKKKNLKQIQLPLEPNHSKSKSSLDEVQPKNGKNLIKHQQTLDFSSFKKSDSSQKHRLIQSKLPLVKDKKKKNKFSSDEWSDMSSNSNSGSASLKPKKSQNQNLRQSTLPLSHQIKEKK